MISLQDPVDSVLYDQKGGKFEGVLGYLVASDGSRKYEISDCYCIGRSVGCWVISHHLQLQHEHPRTYPAVLHHPLPAVPHPVSVRTRDDNSNWFRRLSVYVFKGNLKKLDREAR